MKYDIYFTFSGPGGSIEAPNTSNPVSTNSLSDLLSEALPDFGALGARISAIRIEEVQEPDDRFYGL